MRWYLVSLTKRAGIIYLFRLLSNFSEACLTAPVVGHLYAMREVELLVAEAEREQSGDEHRVA